MKLTAADGQHSGVGGVPADGQPRQVSAVATLGPGDPPWPAFVRPPGTHAYAASVPGPASFAALEDRAMLAIAGVRASLRTAGTDAAAGTWIVRVEWVPAGTAPLELGPLTCRTPAISLGGGWSTCRAATGAWIVESRAYAGLIWASLTLDGRIGWGTAAHAPDPADGWRAAALWRIRWAGEVHWSGSGSAEDRAAFALALGAASDGGGERADPVEPPCPRCEALAAELDELRGLLLEAEAGEDF